MNIDDTLKIYLLLTQTNKLEGVCVSDRAFILADWCCDAVKLTGKVNEIEDSGAGLTDQDMVPSTHQKCTQKSTHTCRRLHG